MRLFHAICMRAFLRDVFRDQSAPISASCIPGTDRRQNMSQTTDEDCVFLHQGQLSRVWCLSTFQACRPNHTQTGIGALHEAAVPMSILLVRKCIYLRSQIDLGRPPKEVSNCIHECMDIYNHWIKTYYDTIHLHFCSNYSWRLLLWIVSLRVRWHWSWLILTELLHQAAEPNNSTTCDEKIPSDVSAIRWRSATSISDITIVSLTSATSDIKATVIGLALLNDPWIEFTIEAMRLAMEVLSSGRNVTDRGLDVRKRSCMNCISLLVSRSTSMQRFQLDARGTTTEDEK